MNTLDDVINQLNVDYDEESLDDIFSSDDEDQLVKQKKPSASSSDDPVIDVSIMEEKERAGKVKEKYGEDTEYNINRTPWTVPIKNHNRYDFNEFGRQFYVIDRVRDPDSNYTDYYSIFCNIPSEFDSKTGKHRWHTLKAFLSNRYCVVRMESLLQVLTDQVEFINEPTLRTDEPFQITVRGKTKLKNTRLFDSVAARKIFSIVVGVPLKKVENIRNGLDLIVVNTYNGEKALTCDFAITFVANFHGQENNFTDYFTLSKLSYRLDHLGKIEQLGEKVLDIETNIDNEIIRLKSKKKNLDDIASKISKKFTKNARNQFLALWEGCVGDYRNLYYLLICASIIMETEFTTSRYISVKKVIDKELKTL